MKSGRSEGFFLLFLVSFLFPLFLQEVKRLDEIILKIHKFKYWKVRSSQKLVEQHWIKKLNFDLLKIFTGIEYLQKIAS